MADQVFQNGNGRNVAERRYPCNFCDKIFTCSQALGGHQNRHRKEGLAAKERHQQPQYDPFDSFSVPPPLPETYPYMDASPYRSPAIQPPRYNSNAYDLQTQFHNRGILSPTNQYPTRYHPCNFSRNLGIGSNGSALTRLNPNLGLLGNSLHGMPMNQSNDQPHHVSRSLNMEYDENSWFMKWLNNYNGNEHGLSPSGEKQGTDQTGKEADKEEELDLTRRL